MSSTGEPIRPDYNEPNYDPAKIAPYTLEDPLTFLSGEKVTSPAQWQARRKEILDIFAKEMFGQEPPPPECVVTELIEEKEDALAGFGVRSQYRMWFKADKSGPALDVLVLRPRFAVRKAKPVLFLNYRGNHELIRRKMTILTPGEMISILIKHEAFSGLDPTLPICVRIEKGSD